MLTKLGLSGAELSSSDLAARRRSGCLAGTRRDVIDQSHEWVFHPSESDNSNILWLYGVPGSGKSAVATTLAIHFSELQRLGAFIRFDRILPGRSHPSTVVLALAHQLARYDKRIATSLVQIINEDDGVLTVALDEQFNRLIVQPFKSILALHGEGPIIVVLDALDECGQPDDRTSLLEVLVDQAQNLPSNLRFIITSRTANDIREAFTVSATHIRIQEIGLACDGIDSDITAYFMSRMRGIRRKNKDLPADWPGQASVARLVSLACGFFAWAVATSNSIDAHSPLERLKSFLEDSSFSEPSLPLDSLYTTALQSAGDWTDVHLLSDFRAIMTVIIASPIPLSIAAIEQSFDRPLFRPLLVTIGRLSALLTIKNHVVQPLHPSFPAFLTNSRRCGRDIWYFEPRPIQDYTFLDPECLQRMNTRLNRNICNIVISAPLNAEALSKDLACACQIWPDYIYALAEDSSRVMETLDVFLRKHLLHWIEAMNIIKKSENIVPMLERAAAWLAVCVVLTS